MRKSAVAITDGLVALVLPGAAWKIRVEFVLIKDAGVENSWVTNGTD